MTIIKIILERSFVSKIFSKKQNFSSKKRKKRESLYDDDRREWQLQPNAKTATVNRINKRRIERCLQNK